MIEGQSETFENPENGAEEKPKTLIEFLKPSEVKAYQPPPGIVLVGDNHIVRDAVFVIAGPPGVGKSRATIALAQCGALIQAWLGYPAHVHFKTMIIQNENGRYRLKLEFSDISCPELEDSLLITPPPPLGLCFDRRDFREQLKAAADLFQPHLCLIDPWNAAARDDRQKDYLETFNDIRAVFPPGLDGPAIGIVAHTRKPYPNERANGRALLNLIAGSYVLGSIPRCVWVLQSASDDVAEERVVLTCCKNNDGQLGPRSPWIRCNGNFVPVKNFDWESFDHSDKDKTEKSIDEYALAEIFDNGNKTMKRADAIETLMTLTGRKRSACYDALNEKTGRLKNWLRLKGGCLVFVP
jgi:hypothetical protein